MISCHNCYIGLDEDLTDGQNLPCPNCGSRQRDYYLQTADGAVEFMGHERAPTFIGRDADLHKLNLLISRRRKAISIAGLAGSGKTTLVRRFVRGLKTLNTEWIDVARNPN